MPNPAEASRPADLTNDSSSVPLASFTGEAMTRASTNKDWFAINAKGRESQQQLPDITIDDFFNNAERVLKSIDLDKDGYVGSNEFAQAVDNPYIKGKDAQVLSALYKLNANSIEQNPLGGYHNPMQFLKIDRAKQQIQTILDAGSIRNVAPHNKELMFPKLDRNGDDILSRRELSEAMKDPELANGSLAVAMKMFHRRDARAFAEGKTYQGLSQEDVTNLNRVIGDTGFSARLNVERAIENTGRAQRGIKTTEAFADKDNPLDSISSDAINQGSVGNCYFLSTLAKVADKRPEVIRDMIMDQGHGNYKVTFPGDRENPVYVSTPSDTNIGQFNRANERGMWPNILEKAFGKYEAASRNLVQENIPNAMGADAGGDAAQAIYLLTGNEADTHELNTLYEINKDNPRFIQHRTDMFTQWLDEGRMLIAGSGNSNPEENKFNIPPTHAITMQSHFEKDGKTYFVMRDPWGDHSRVKGNRDGVFTLEAKDLFESFQYVSVEHTKK